MKKSVPLFVLFIVLSIFALSGCSGSDGSAGPAGPTGPAGPAGPAAPVDAASLTASASQYATAQAAGFTGTQAQLLSLSYASAAALSYSGTEAEWSALQTSANAAVSLAASVSPESCAVCHKTAGSDHQAYYDQLNKIDAAGIQVSNITYAYAAGTTTVSFKMTKVGADFNCKDADNLNIYWSGYDGATFPKDTTAGLSEGRTSMKGTLAYDGAGTCTSTYSTIDLGNLAAGNGTIAVYGYDEKVASVPGGRVTQAKYPFASVKKFGTVNYTSAANVAGCEKCHTIPYGKHGTILGATKVAGGAATEFYTCKPCHKDDGEGGHFEWPLAVNDPTLAASYDAGDGTALTAAQETEYGYKTTLMNDVHMSHAMEFLYPQSMSNCVVCHEGKIATITADAQFKIETCKSCHPFSGTSSLSLPTLAGHAMPANGVCNNCHNSVGGIAPAFSAIHSGYDKVLYAAADKKYKDIFAISIDSATLSGTDLTVKFKATKTDPTSATTLAVTDIKPTLSIGLYGYNTKDFIVDAHGSATINGVSVRNLEYAVGATHPRFTTVSAAGGAWEVKASLADWAAKITDGTIKRVEIVVLPKLTKVLGQVDSTTNLEANSLATKDYVVPVAAPSKTFDLTTKAFVNYFSPITKVSGATTAAAGCDNCHGALGRTFHSPSYGGGGTTVCRVCHTTRPGGSHLEMQSRSIDSYVHAIHSNQPFDIQNIDFADPFTLMEYKLETGDLGAGSFFSYPTFTTRNCKSCHVAGTFEVPDQSKSLGGTLSASRDTLKSRTRSITGVPSYVTGPAARACGSCHRTNMINRDDLGGLVSLSQHTKDNGYRAVATDSTVFDTVITKIMEAFK
ncbi:MAG: hypothetical protein M0P74_10180 [Syntrophales bacterium]|jgi:OmcA/MtrC family decaheme c-type cytochrome|nr:hypothetical protein [Syntrophales bacterium]